MFAASRLTTAFLALVLAAAASAATSPTAQDARVRELLARMSLEEKIGQLNQYSSRELKTGPGSDEDLVAMVTRGQIGSLLNVIGAEETRKWQKLAVESSRHHIPLLFGLDVIHGYRTVFPIPLATAASWDLALIERAERIAATETAAAGVHWTFAPMVDISRDPRWGRMSEGPGEDPYLAAAIARARVHGFQGDDLAAVDTVLACVKHFAAYGAAQAGRDYFTTDVTERVLRDVYLPPFRAAVDAGVGTVMAAFNDLDGTPASANAFLLDRVLRREWGFRGFVVSDWASIREMLEHGNVANLHEAGLKAFAAGLDMDMESNAYRDTLAADVKSGVIAPARLDAAVTAILTAKARLGLLDDPFRYSDESREKATLLKPEFLAAAREAACRSCVLLKNEHGILPLATGNITVGLVGPLADAPYDQMGAWHGRGRKEDSITLLRALEQLLPPERLKFAAGCAANDLETAGIVAARRVAEESDVVIVAVGEGADQSGEATSRASLDLSGPQLELLREVHAAGKPIVLVLLTGRPLMIEAVEPLVDAILVAWHPGTMGGPAITDVLTGAYNPSGRLPVTWPRSVGQIPIFHAQKNSGRPQPKSASDRYYSHYIDSPNTPLYPFGFGLSYTHFEYDQLRLSAPRIQPDAALSVTVRVRNAGARAGEDVVQLYLRDHVGSVTRPVRELKGFRKISLAAGEAQDVSFTLTPAELAFWRADMTFGVEPGTFSVFVGANAMAPLTASFEVEPAVRAASR
ncbi:glycoside hydrolase family 3 N-terminal domain-containing protein [Opitutus sp. ER46]|uniref:glycoside hydrolase family 3 N-terminal domain-containing protein n=1 Tax=Opitutus sp. ER46 TaxID=2161864 RepID=UPI000D300C83|nr:glycoside hydrolase family 3 N-terminal domain-containing protein [Opitutus sp. ER46]PTX96482.1 glycosyl hydrolase [Opitutus sp. ER46]